MWIEESERESGLRVGIDGTGTEDGEEKEEEDADLEMSPAVRCRCRWNGFTRCRAVPMIVSVRTVPRL